MENKLICMFSFLVGLQGSKFTLGPSQRASGLKLLLALNQVVLVLTFGTVNKTRS